jgi:hypothetical protein
MWRCQWLPSSISILPMSSRNCLQVGRRRRISILPMSSRNKQMALRAQKREHNFHFTRVVAKRVLHDALPNPFPFYPCRRETSKVSKHRSFPFYPCRRETALALRATPFFPFHQYRRETGTAGNSLDIDIYFPFHQCRRETNRRGFRRNPCCYLSISPMSSRNPGKMAVNPPILPTNFISLAVDLFLCCRETLTRYKLTQTFISSSSGRRKSDPS